MYSNIKYRYINFFLIICNILLLNYIFGYYPVRIDLTADQRYTLHETTKTVLQNTEGHVIVDVYLSGDLPAGFRRLQNSIRETLTEFRTHTSANIEYRFNDPAAIADEKERNATMMQLAQKGLQPTNIYHTKDGKQTEKLIFPGALITCRGKQTPIHFLKGSEGASPQEILNQSVEGVEYELINAIKIVTTRYKLRIAIAADHGEPKNAELNDLYMTLKDRYMIERINISETANIKAYDLLIIIRPTLSYQDADKLKLDQYIMNGGKIIFFLDQAILHNKNLSNEGTMITPAQHNLEDLLFKLGVRANQDLIQDIQCGAIPLVVGSMGNSAQTRLMPWPYHVIHNNYGKHATVRNMGAVLCKYASTLDTVKATNVTKTPLIYTSSYAQKIQLPYKVSLEDAKKNLETDMKGGKNYITAYLLEGRFKSLYNNRLSQYVMDSIKYLNESKHTRIMVFSDADYVINEVSTDEQQAFPLGYDRYIRKKFANIDLIQNIVNYMLDDKNMLTVRNKQIVLRTLDKKKITAERAKWQIINTVVPLLLLFAFGIIKYYLRVHKYAQYTP
ncbi:MAG: gliding motility-associated ABC transporter substrate-binding protein GldG [Cytophagales bacterium]|nr:gliding motility-associated ABC transporter substrate-binding protein GldG [Cytophagales bacterium]